MRKIFRDKINSDYWEERWLNSGVDEDEFKNEDIYPIKYAKEIVSDGDKILEAGCGAGRVYFHYKNRGLNIKGIEFSKSAVRNILNKDQNSEVVQGSIVHLPYDDNSFNKILAFGLYHNIEDKDELKKAFSETKRVLQSGGYIVASVRCDSFENNLIERIVQSRSKTKKFNKFHRWHFSLKDMKQFLGEEIDIEKVYYTRNVSFLFKYDFFRSQRLKSSLFKESHARSIGFELNLFGKVIDYCLHGLFPKYFSNLLVIIARKK